MATDNPSFLDTEQEHARWHEGIYRGLVVHDPRKLRKTLRANDKGWRAWYRNDGHYHDVPMLAVYSLKFTAYGLGVFGASTLGLL